MTAHLAERESTAAMRNPFVGTWRLLSCELRTLDGRVVGHPLGANAVGYLLYADDGYMSVTMMAADRPQFAASDISFATADERAGAASTYLSYSGRYEIQQHKVIHRIELSLFPNWTGVDQERLFEFSGDRLTLSTPPFISQGGAFVLYIVWQRVSATA